MVDVINMVPRAHTHAHAPVISASCIFHSDWLELSGGSDDVSFQLAARWKNRLSLKLNDFNARFE